MTPRTVVFALPREMTIDEALERHPNLPFSRIPVYGDSRDDVRAFVLRTDLLNEKLAGRGARKLGEISREIQAVSEKASLEMVFEHLIDNQIQILLVLDEFGGLAGLVTLEDVVETLLGLEIIDEDDETENLRQLARQRWEEKRRRLGIDP